ncbi:hypothetical protein [Amycolatopsis sp. WGS_07]|uniref:hypothetical protein n=1 Tax=Amycolatopsis sp. WGS_07 TaxID=3076764 RepID=UPI0038733292
MAVLAEALGVHAAYFLGGRQERDPGERHGWRPGALPKLFATVHPPGRGAFSPEEAAEAISVDGRFGTISATYVRDLQSGAKSNPQLKHILGLRTSSASRQRISSTSGRPRRSTRSWRR